MSEPLKIGLYESILTSGLRSKIAQSHELISSTSELDPAESHLLLSKHLQGLLEIALKSYSSENKLNRQLELSSRILDLLKSEFNKTFTSDDSLSITLLESIQELEKGGLTKKSALPRPGIPLSASELLVNGPGEYRIGHEIETEIQSADSIDVLMSFIKWSGIRVLSETLASFLSSGKEMRVITTVYMGATERRALDFLVKLGAKVHVSYDTRRTRLHAKAWLFHRSTGYSTAYIGSSNLSAAAQLDGLEWNVRLSAIDAPRILNKFEATFNTYWKEDEFVSYELKEDCYSQFDAAIRKERSDGNQNDVVFFDTRPHQFQQEILEKLEVERKVHGRFANLIVAATGTGKTFVAAFDFRNLLKVYPNLTLLFVAHRKEILTQSRSVFRNVLRDGNFGELYVDGARPSSEKHLFASVQSLSRLDLESVSAKSWDMVIIDEFHHAAAPTYERLLNHLRPTYLLGLTATPERSDGQDIVRWFGGRFAAEIRLWDAIDRGYLVPFQYFGVHDNTDLSRLQWVRGRYDEKELDALYTGNDIRVNMILSALQDKISNIPSMRCLGFCVGVAHAEFMAARFQRAGIPSMALTGQCTKFEREEAIQLLRKRKINILFTVDLFNEGVDIPEVDTVLFLRPTESATIFLQQLGRGLRRHEEKECLTVLDFIGKAHRSFRFDFRFRALTQSTRHEVKRHVENGFPLLPSGCSIKLDRESQEQVLNNLSQALGADRRSLISELSRFDELVELSDFLRESGLELEDIYRGGRFYSDLLRAAGQAIPKPGKIEDQLGRNIYRLLHIDDPERLNLYVSLLGMAANKSSISGEIAKLVEIDRRRVMMFVCTFFGPESACKIDESIKTLFSHPAIVWELQQLFPILQSRISHIPKECQLPPEVPLRVHCSYSRDEIMAAFNDVRKGRLYQPREGVSFDETSKANLLFVTLHKSEKEYSPSTMYDDYAISSTEFHWQSQSGTRPETKKGLRHTDHVRLGIRPMLFLRDKRLDDTGKTKPYVFLGDVSYVLHAGMRPMNITWKMATPIPADYLKRARVA